MEKKMGLIPLEYHVIVLPDPIEDSITMASGVKILLADTSETSKRRQAKQEKATLIEVSSNAFEGWDVSPSIGSRIMMNQYAGDIVVGNDGVEYRIIKDSDIKMLIVS